MISRAQKVVREALLQDAPALVTLVVFAAIGYAVHRVAGKPPSLEISFFSWWLVSVVLIYVIPAVLLSLVYEVVVLGNPTLAVGTWRSIGTRLFAPKLLVRLFVFLVAFPILLSLFTAFKSAIPSFIPFAWDVRFMEWDAWLHLGHHPWELIHPLFGAPRLTYAIDRLYALWFVVLWMTTVWQAWHGDERSGLRSQYLLCFVLCWVMLGVLAATLLSSAGPVYFARVTDGVVDPYATLMAYLDSVNASGLEIRALWGQGYLWDAYVGDDPRLFSGISAMPSLHVATATLMTIVAFKTKRWLGWAYALFAVGIFIGSIHLGWHYAIDGYVAVAATFGLWWLSGRVVGWWRRTAVHLTGAAEGV